MFHDRPLIAHASHWTGLGVGSRFASTEHHADNQMHARDIALPLIGSLNSVMARAESRMSACVTDGFRSPYRSP